MDVSEAFISSGQPASAEQQQQQREQEFLDLASTALDLDPELLKLPVVEAAFTHWQKGTISKAEVDIIVGMEKSLQQGPSASSLNASGRSRSPVWAFAVPSNAFLANNGSSAPPSKCLKKKAWDATLTPKCALCDAAVYANDSQVSLCNCGAPRFNRENAYVGGKKIGNKSSCSSATNDLESMAASEVEKEENSKVVEDEDAEGAVLKKDCNGNTIKETKVQTAQTVEAAKDVPPEVTRPETAAETPAHEEQTGAQGTAAPHGHEQTDTPKEAVEEEAEVEVEAAVLVQVQAAALRRAAEKKYKQEFEAQLAALQREHDEQHQKLSEDMEQLRVRLQLAGSKNACGLSFFRAAC